MIVPGLEMSNRSRRDDQGVGSNHEKRGGDKCASGRGTARRTIEALTMPLTTLWGSYRDAIG